MILGVALLGNPVLRGIARPFTAGEIAAPETQRLVEDMIETMREYSGVGLAAPQVQVPGRLVVMESMGDPPAQALPLQVLFNPELSLAGAETEEDWEGCLSVPDLRGKVPRARTVRVKALDREGRPLEFIAEGLHARILQHECDHLDGRVFLDRMTDLSSLTHLAEFRRISKEAKSS
ncbi:MAG: peptide deformylase [Elusimicrobiota bacterium]